MNTIATPTQATGRTYTQEEMEIAFGKVHAKGDWKAPIDAMVPVSEIGVTVIAIIHFTGTVPTADTSSIAETGLVRVKAVGYRMGPCGDH